MRIAELSRRTGVPVPTVKYYLRENLLPAGELTSPNQARYTDDHVRRLRLIRALVNVGGLSIGQARDVLAAVDSPDQAHNVLGVVQEAITPTREQEHDESWQAALRDVEELIARRGWRARADSGPGRALAAVMVSLRELGREDFIAVYDEYAAACERIAEIDIDYVEAAEKVEDLVERMVVGTVLGDAAIVAIRRLAHQDASDRRFDC
jgi:DNA-binding transcriptional MerR regulator